MPSSRLLALAHRYKTDCTYKFIPWKLRLSERAQEELTALRPRKVPKLEVTFFEYLEEIVLYCYKKNTNLKAYRLNWLRERSGGLGLLGAPPSRCP